MRLYRDNIEEAGLTEEIRDGVVVDFDLVDSHTIAITGQIAGNLKLAEGITSSPQSDTGAA